LYLTVVDKLEGEKSGLNNQMQRLQEYNDELISQQKKRDDEYSTVNDYIKGLNERNANLQKDVIDLKAKLLEVETNLQQDNNNLQMDNKVLHSILRISHELIINRFYSKSTNFISMFNLLLTEKKSDLTVTLPTYESRVSQFTYMSSEQNRGKLTLKSLYASLGAYNLEPLLFYQAFAICDIGIKGYLTLDEFAGPVPTMVDGK